ncbi:MAG TPA: acetyl-CoA carboxylase carboxyltransferase subunit alpha [Candidatus Scatovicinus merdipullorum]|nr:acetyl-CoA carboxylase carboxyltransferase subunit alpha [Candidatus Scatovicinus merdipullorum]
MSAFDKVVQARSNNRLTSVDYINSLFGDTFFEMHGDRRFGDDKAVIGGLASLENMPVTVIGLERGRDTKERIERNFGSPHPEGYRKALRLMKQAEKFNRPVLCLVDTSGAFCGIGAEERGQGQAIAENLMEMSALKTPILTILIGEGESGGALGLAVADEVWMLENAVYSVISPEGCASILWKDSTKTAEAAECLKLTAQDLFQMQVIERIIREPKTKESRMFESLKGLIYRTFEKYAQMDVQELLQRRYDRFRKFGQSSIMQQTIYDAPQEEAR